ncbi:MAG: hypothetical protein AAB903_03075 [Patescibacteria group bacterium]
MNRIQNPDHHNAGIIRIVLAIGLAVGIGFFGYGVARGFKNVEFLRQAKIQLCAQTPECCGSNLDRGCQSMLDNTWRQLAQK